MPTVWSRETLTTTFRIALAQSHFNANSRASLDASRAAKASQKLFDTHLYHKTIPGHFSTDDMSGQILYFILYFNRLLWLSPELKES